MTMQGSSPMKRRVPKPRDLAPLMQFKKPQFDAKKRRLDAALTIEDLRAHVRSRVEHLTGLRVGKIAIEISWLNPSSHVRKSLK